MGLSGDRVRRALEAVEDPEMGLSIVELGLVRDIHVSDDHVQVELTLTSPSCPYAPQLIRAVEIAVVHTAPDRKPIVELVWDPPWDPNVDPTEDARAELGIWT